MEKWYNDFDTTISSTMPKYILWYFKDDWWGIWISENNISLFYHKSEILIQICPKCEQKQLKFCSEGGKIKVNRNKVSLLSEIFLKSEILA